MSESPHNPHRRAPGALSADDDLDAFEPPELEPADPPPRFDGWTPNRQVAFIQAPGESGCVAEARRAVGMAAQSAYALRARAISSRNARRGHRHHIGITPHGQCEHWDHWGHRARLRDPRGGVS